jgi:hypothetical protein
MLVAAGASVVALGLAGPASAAITATQVTDPANLSHLLLNRDASGATIHIAGTATGATTGDKVAVVCVFPNGGAVGLAANVDASSGAFSADAPIASIPPSPCVIRAPAAPLGPSEGPGQPSLWAGPVILPGWRKTTYVGNNAANPAFDFGARTHKSAGAWAYQTAGGCLISDSWLIDPATFGLSSPVFFCNASFFETNNASVSQGTRSQLVVDAKNAYLPYEAQTINGSAAHFPALAPPIFTYDQSTGDLSVHYVERIVRCAGTGPDPFPADSGNCTDFADTGVQLDSWVSQNGDGSVSTALQRLSATDGNTHQVDALSEQQFWHENSSGGYAFPWVGSSYQGYAAGSAIAPPPAGSGSMLDKNDIASADGTLAGAQGAVTWAAAPQSVKVTRGTSDPMQFSELELGYRRTVTSSSPMWLGWSFALGTTRSAIAAAAHTAEVSFTPRITVATPADGATTGAGTAHVTGTAGDDSGAPVAVDVNGHAATVDASGNWGQDVPLSPGANTLTATVTNRYDTTATVRRTITRTVAPLPHRFRGARFRGSHSLRLDRKGNVVLRIACPSDATSACSGTVSLVSASAVSAATKGPRPKRIKLGAKRFKAAAGKTVKVTIHVSAKARRYIAKHHKMGVKLTIAARDASAASKKTSAKLTIRAARAKRA